MVLQVYTHDRTLGTSSLIRHQCSQDGGAEKARPGKTGNLPKLLVQELVNTKSARSVSHYYCILVTSPTQGQYQEPGGQVQCSTGGRHVSVLQGPGGPQGDRVHLLQHL